MGFEPVSDAKHIFTISDKKSVWKLTAPPASFCTAMNYREAIDTTLQDPWVFLAVITQVKSRQLFKQMIAYWNNLDK